MSVSVVGIGDRFAIDSNQPADFGSGFTDWKAYFNFQRELRFLLAKPDTTDRGYLIKASIRLAVDLNQFSQEKPRKLDLNLDAPEGVEFVHISGEMIPGYGFPGVFVFDTNYYQLVKPLVTSPQPNGVINMKYTGLTGQMSTVTAQRAVPKLVPTLGARVASQNLVPRVANTGTHPSVVR